jgi:glycerol-3-phosphate dehydrogenase subunit C
MPQLTPESLLTLEAYSKTRAEFRRQVMAHKARRTLALGKHMRLLFEDEMTIRYQIQEMLRAERIFEEEGIRHELETYNPLIPDGRNFKATMMIEYEDPAVRKRELSQLIGIEDKVWMQVAGFARVQAIADEDLERENEEKTSSVHFLRFELDEPMAAALKSGAALSAGVDHPHYRASADPVPATLREALLADLA